MNTEAEEEAPSDILLKSKKENKWQEQEGKSVR